MSSASPSKPPRPTRDRLLSAALEHVPADGWSDTALIRARRALGLPRDAERLLVPGGGRELLEEWARARIAAASSRLADERLRGTTRRVERGVSLLLEELEAQPELTARASARLLLPDAAPLAVRLLGLAADAVWSAVPDTSTDYNWYTKRAILSGVLAATLLQHKRDTSPAKRDTRAVLARHLERAVMLGRFGGRGVRFALDMPERAFVRARAAQSSQSSQSSAPER